MKLDEVFQYNESIYYVPSLKCKINWVLIVPEICKCIHQNCSQTNTGKVFDICTALLFVMFCHPSLTPCMCIGLCVYVQMHKRMCMQ